jgi:hypothetical protein
MSCFIKKIFDGNIDDSAHRQFVRFSRGSFAGRAALSLQKKERIKLGGSFEFANDFSDFVAENSDAKFSGIVLSREEISDFGKEKGKNGIFEYNVENIESQKLNEIKDKSYALLLDAEGEGISLNMKKKKLPKPGKSGELKIDDKFCIIECDLKYWEKMKEFFMLPDCKKAKISHTYIIEEVMVDKNEKDFVKMRENAKKKGKIIRKMNLDGRETQEEKSFEA